MSERRFPTTVVLSISLAVNLLLVGAAIGVVLAGARLHRPAAGRLFGPARAFMGAIPPQQLADIRQKLEDAWRTSAPEREAARTARADLIGAIQQEPFDEAKVRAALARMRAADEALSAKNQDAVIGVLKNLPPGARLSALGGVLRLHGLGRGPHGSAPAQPGPPP